MKNRLLQTLLLACVFTSADLNAQTSASESVPKTVLITGASTGIGRKITERLAASGWRVYAGARKPADLEQLARIPNVQAVTLDVTNAADIAAAVQRVTKDGRGLDALVNNAGVALTAPLANTREADFDWLMQVNVYGPFRVTQAFAPLIIASRGRITTIGSISGTLSPKDLGAYSMSKHAMEAFTDSLALEMAPLGVQVSIVEPGNYNSEIGATAAKRTGAPSRLANRSRFKDPDDVADTVLLALTEAAPRRRYMIVPNQQEAEVTIRKAIEEVVQLNEGQPYAYDRAALIEMFDASLAKARHGTATAPAATPAAAPVSR